MGHVQMRRARMRSLAEGKQVQTVRAESMENDGKDAVERWQDYGFAGNPVEGQGLIFHVDGHTVVFRKDRLAERPHLAAYEVSVWHKEGHHITLRDGKLVECECDHFVLKAKEDVSIETKRVSVKASEKIVNDTPLDQVTGIAQPQNLTIGGITGGGNAIMNGGTWTMQNVTWTVTNGATAYVGGSFTYNGKNMTNTHYHVNSGGSGNGGAVG